MMENLKINRISVVSFNFLIVLLMALLIPIGSLNAQSEEGEGLPDHSFNINPLGILQFGPILQYEAKVSDRSVIVPYLRYGYLGLATHAVWGAFDDGARLSPATFGLGLGLKGFDSETGNAIYYGGFVDFDYGKANYDIGTSTETEEIATGLGLISNFGYRWKNPNGNYINLGLFAGAGFTLNDEERYVSTDELYATYNETIFFGMIELSFGW